MYFRKEYLFLSVVLLTILLSLSCHKNQQDDAYIFYTYAHNIADGNGYVFNLDEKINATTSPFYTLLTAFIYYILSIFISGIDVPAAGELITAVSIFFSAYALYKIFRHFREERLSYSAPLLFLMNPLIRNSAGMESFLMLALLLWGTFFFFLKKFNISAFFLALLILTRFDAALFIIVLLLWLVFKEKRIPPLMSILIFFVTAVPWFVFSQLYFGMLIPSTIYIKLTQTSSEFFGTGLVYLKGIFRVFPGGIFVSGLIIGLLIGSFIFILVRNRDRLKNPFFIIIIFWTLSHFLIYAFILNPPPYPWYYAPYTLLFTVIFSAALEEIYKLFHHRKIFYVFFVVVLLAGLIIPLKTIFSPYNYKYRMYTAAAEWLNSNASPGSSVLLDEIGIVGYYYRQGKIIDVFGLVNPESAVKINAGDYDWTIQHYKPDYIIADYPNNHKYLDAGGDVMHLSYSEKAIIGQDSKVIIYSRK